MRQDGGPAFPVSYTVDLDHQKLKEFCGMTLRDWFAGQIIAGIMMDPDLNGSPDKHLAVLSYKLADAMLAERDKQ